MSKHETISLRETGPATLTLYPTGHDAGRGAVMVCPGGGYQGLADHEGAGYAEALNHAGFDAAVLRYRLTTDGSTHPDMLHDAQRATRLTRQWLASLKRSNPRVAAMGSSAGGHLVATLAAYHDQWADERDDLRDAQCARPDALVMCYPVIDMEGVGAHTASRKNLLGASPDAALLRALSLQHTVRAGHMPVFLWSTADDASVPVSNSILYAQACWAAHVPCELHVYETGRHGLGRAEQHEDVRTWFDHAVMFLRRHLAA